jgi:hypothetical protein
MFKNGERKIDEVLTIVLGHLGFWGLGVKTGKNYVKNGCDGNGNGSLLSTPYAIPIGTPTRVCLVRRGEQIGLYLNGKCVSRPFNQSLIRKSYSRSELAADTLPVQAIPLIIILSGKLKTHRTIAETW